MLACRHEDSSAISLVDGEQALIDIPDHFDQLLESCLAAFEVEAFEAVLKITASSTPASVEEISDLSPGDTIILVVSVDQLDPSDGPEKRRKTLEEEVEEERPQHQHVAELKAIWDASTCFGRMMRAYISACVQDWRPFYQATHMELVVMDLAMLLPLVILPLMVGVFVALMPTKANVSGTNLRHNLNFLLLSLPMLCLSSAAFTCCWISFWFRVRLPWKLVLVSVPVSPFIYFVFTRMFGFPFMEGPVIMLTATILLTYIIFAPIIPIALREKTGFWALYCKSFFVILAPIIVFVMNKIMVARLAGRADAVLFLLAVIYPLLVYRGTTDCTHIARSFNRRSGGIIEALSIFVSALLQEIVFLTVRTGLTQDITTFFLINAVDFALVAFLGPPLKLIKRRRRTHHTESTKTIWARDPFKVKGLVILTYSNISARIVFLLVAVISRYVGDCNRFAMVSDNVDQEHFSIMCILALIEIVMWACGHVGIEWYARGRKSPWLVYDAKRSLVEWVPILATGNAMMTALLLLEQTPYS